MKRIFEPFFTTKAIGYGTGMGLPVVHGILHRFGGHIVTESVPGIGTQFTLLLVPANTQDLEASLTVPPPVTVETETVTNARVLVVDDEPQLCKLTALILRKQGYEVVSHTDPQAALAAFRAEPDRFDAVITDQTMPGLSATMLAEAIRALRPSLPILLCSGYRDRGDGEDLAEVRVDRFLEKPVSAATLVSSVAELLTRQRGLSTVS
jgi:CheY-like chemotaxis protein